MSIYCNKCGSQLEDDARFCNSCGANVGGSAEPEVKPTPVQTQTPIQPIPPVQPQSAPQPTTYQNINYINNDPQNRPVTIGDWIITTILLAIPCVGIIMLFVWAFDKSTPLSKQNFCKATLIMALIGFTISIVFFVIAIIAGYSFTADHIYR